MANVVEWGGFHVSVKMIAAVSMTTVGRNSFEGRIHIIGWPNPGYLSKDFQRKEDAIAAVAEVVRNMEHPDEDVSPRVEPVRANKGTE